MLQLFPHALCLLLWLLLLRLLLHWRWRSAVGLQYADHQAQHICASDHTAGPLLLVNNVHPVDAVAHNLLQYVSEHGLQQQRGRSAGEFQLQFGRRAPRLFGHTVGNTWHCSNMQPAWHAW